MVLIIEKGLKQHIWWTFAILLFFPPNFWLCDQDYFRVLRLKFVLSNVQAYGPFWCQSCVFSKLSPSKIYVCQLVYFSLGRKLTNPVKNPEKQIARVGNDKEQWVRWCISILEKPAHATEFQSWGSIGQREEETLKFHWSKLKTGWHCTDWNVSKQSGVHIPPI